MKSLLLSTLLIILLSIPSLALAQTYLWEENFDPPHVGWTLEDNWSMQTGNMYFNWSPSVTDYNLSASSPVITLPDNAGDLLVTQYATYFSYVDEAFEIAVLHGDEVDILWSHTGPNNWGTSGGSLLTLSLIPYQNQNIQIRFRSYGTSTYNTDGWWIYHLAIEGSFDDDLEALSIAGPTTPSVGTTADYTVTVRNNGVNTQTNYTVKLMKQGEIELGSVPGTVIETGETADFTFSWTPAEEGPTFLYGEVELDDDEVPENDTTVPYNIVVMPDDVLVVTIGTGTETNTTTGAAPVNIYYRSIRTQTVYTAAELNQQGLYGTNEFISLAYYVTSPPLYNMPNFRIRMRHTTATDASEHIEGPYELVYQNASFMPEGDSWNLMALANPFEWNGIDNILVDTAFDMVEPTYNASGQQYIFASDNGMRYIRSDSSNQGEAVTTLIAAYKPQLQIQYTPGMIYEDDMAAITISGPPNLSPGSEGTFFITVRNMGTNDQDNYPIRLMRDGDIELTSIVGTVNLEQYQSHTYEVNWTPAIADEGVLTIWGEVALVGDENPVNNTTYTIDLVVADAFSGVYSINHDGTGDFISFTQALNSLTAVGVDGPTVFEVADGTYTEQLVVTEIMGASETNTITFTGTGDTIDDVELTYNPSDTNNRHIVKLDGAKHVRFDNLKISVDETAGYGWVFHITNASENIEITNCHLSTVTTSTSTFYSGIIVSGSPTGSTTTGNNVNTILIESNTIVGGYYGITLVGAAETLLQNATVTGNTIQDAYYHGIYANQTTEPVISENSINMRSEGTTTNFGSAIYSMNSDGPFEFSRNRILNPGQYGIYISASNSTEQPSLIANNMIGGGFRNTGTLAAGIYITTSSNVGVYYNSINNDSLSGRGIYSLDTVTQLYIKNNSFVFSGTGNGYAAYHVSTAGLAAHDHNNYYSGTSSNFVYYGAEISNLSALQAVNIPENNDQNSLDVDPLYLDNYNLDIDPASQLIGAAVPLPEVLTDFHGNPRHLEYPTLGAHEIDLANFGTLDGFVFDLSDNEPLSGVNVQVGDTNYSTLSGDNGTFLIPFVMQGTYSVTASLFGYHDQTIENVVIIPEETTTLTFNIAQLANVTVSGQVVGSDYPTVGIENAELFLTGYHDYNTISGANGMFTIPNVYSNHTYTLTIYAEGYSVYQEDVIVGNTDLDLGILIVDEIAFPPRNVIATQSADDTSVDLIWNTPIPVVSYLYDFEDGEQGWTTGAIGGAADHWQLGTPAQTNINSAHSGTNAWMTRLNQDYDNNANTWLRSPELDLTNMQDVYFSVWLNIWCESGFDGMILEASTDGGNNWIHVRSDDSAPFEFYNNSSTSGPIDPPKWSGRTPGVHGIWTEFSTFIPELAGENSVYFRFRFGSDSSVITEGIAVDDVYIGQEPPSDIVSDLTANTQILLFDTEQERSSRLIEGYVIYRFLYEDLNNEDNWLELATVADTTYTDLTWDTAAGGFYRYAVKGEYTNNVLSPPAISNWVGKDMTTNVTVNITTDVGDSAEGAAVQLFYQDQDPDGNSPVFSGTAAGTDPSVATLLNVLRGIYNIEVTLPGYTTYTQSDVNIQTPTVLDVVLDEIPYPPVNLVYTAGNNLVSLGWDAPNPAAMRDNPNTPSYSEVFSKLQEMGITDKEEMEREIRAILSSSSGNLQAENRNSRNETRTNNRNNRALLGYNVYRDGMQINTDPVEVTVYNDTTVENNVTYIYYVTAVYTLSESEPSNSISVVPGPNQLIIIGEDTTSANTLPFNFYWRNSLSQTIYMADELNIAGVITQIQYYSSFSTDLQNMPVKIWMGLTNQTDLTAGWIPSTQLELVFDDNVDFPSGENTIAIDLDEFFFYDGTQNLVVFANRPMDTTYYSSLDHFYYSTTAHENRSRNINSDSVEYDPANPPDGGTLTNRVPNTGLYVVTVGMGSLDGYVYDENDQPMAGAMITVAGTDFVQYSNVQGFYLFPFMYEGTHSVTASKFGYYDGVAENVVVEEYETTTVDFTLTPLPTVTVSGRIVGSDQPDIGLDNAFILIDGYNYYETNGDDNGLFSIPGVYADHTYTMTVQRSGYSTLNQEIAVGDIDLDLGDVVVNELAFPPFDVTAVLSPDNTEAYVEWVSPDEYDQVEFRYDDGVPVTAIGLPDGTDNSVLGAVHRRSAILNTISWYTTGATAHPSVNVFIFGLNAQGTPNSNVVLYQETEVPNNHLQWTIYELSDEIEAPNGFFIGLSVNGNLGLAADDGTGEPYNFQNDTHYYTSNFTTGTWSTMESAGFTNNFLIRAQGFDLGPVRVSGEISTLRATQSNTQAPGSELRSQKVFNTDDLESVDLSALAINPHHPAQNKSMTSFRTDRILVEFIVYRLQAGDEETPDLWDEIATVPVTQTSVTDIGIADILNGSYRYAVRSVYTNNVLSLPSLSNIIEYEESIPSIANLEAEVIGNDVHLSWEIQRQGQSNRVTWTERANRDQGSGSPCNRALLGFRITRNGPVIADGIMKTSFIDEDLEPDEYLYSVIGLFTNGSTNMLYETAIVYTGIDDNDPLVPLITELLGNSPNPFNPDTVISYSLETEGPVMLEIFNIRGQLVKTMVNEHQPAGRYSVVWKGKDEAGRSAGSGIYFYRMTTASYRAAKKMIMLK
jgi:hypothetical protein